MPPTAPVFITAYGPKLDIGITFDPAEGKTKQEFKDDCDINVLLKRYQETGSLEHVNQRQALFADVSAMDYQEAMNIIADARSAFLDLPAKVRDRFNNDPHEFLAFVEDPENAAEAGELGLLSPEGEEALAAEAAKASADAAAAAAASVSTTTPLPAATKGS